MDPSDSAMKTVPDACPDDTGQGVVRRRRALGWVTVVLMAGIVPLLAMTIAGARGPVFYELNTDPEYAYLFNSLRIAEGHSPIHTDHPGTTVQVIGAGVLLARQAAATETTVRERTLADPEGALAAIRVTIVALVTLLSLASGALVLRATGSLLHAACIQATPLVVSGSAVLMDRDQPEPLLVGLGMALCAGALVVVHRPPCGRNRRAAALMGVIVGLGVATKVLFAPLLIIPLAALPTRRLRLLYAVCAVGSLAVAILPAAPRIPRMVRWLGLLVTRSGRYGSGGKGLVDLGAYPRHLAELVTLEPVYAGAAGAGLALAAWAAVRWVRRPGGPPARMVRTLGAASLAQLSLLLVVAKSPEQHYLASAGAGAALALSLSASVAGTLHPRAARPTGALVACLLAALGLYRWQTVRAHGDWLGAMAQSEAQTRAFLADPVNVDVVRGLRVSAPESALHFGNFFAGGRYTADLERLYPGVFLWDGAGITAFGRPATPSELAAIRPDGTFRALVSGWFDARFVKQPGLRMSTVRSFGHERLVVVGERAEVPPGTPAFCGFTAVRGLSAEETPRAEPGARVRWGLAPETVLSVNSGGEPLLVMLECRPHLLPGQSVTLWVDGASVRTRPFESRHAETIVQRLDLPEGDHELRLSYANAQNVDGRELAVLFRKIQVVPAPR
jgi:hypothetical protein